MGLPEWKAETEWSLAYWEWMAKFGRKRFWWSGWEHWWALAIGDDEFNRRTVVLGPVVVALWQCRCRYCKDEAARLQAIIDADPTPESTEPPVLDETHYTTAGWHPASECEPSCIHWNGG